MPFGKKNHVEPKVRYALVLNPVRSELTKSRMIERMIQVFPLAIEEASDLVENTPIVLLENVEHDVGEQIKGYFAETGADLSLTDDRSFQRRCYRAIWPSPPRFDFIHTESSSKEVPVENKIVEESSLEDSKTPENSFAPGEFNSQASDNTSLHENPVRPEVFESPHQSDISFSTRETQFHSSAPEKTQTDRPIEPVTAEDLWRKNRLEEVELATTNALQEEKITQLVREQEKLQAIISSLQKENDEFKTEQLKALQLRKDFNVLQETQTQLEGERTKLVEDLKKRELEQKTLEGNLRQIEADRVTFIKARQNELKGMEENFQKTEHKLEEEKSQLVAQREELKKANQTQTLQLEELNKNFKTEQEKLKFQESETARIRSEIDLLGNQNQELKTMLAESQARLIQHEKDAAARLYQLENEIGDAKAALENEKISLQEANRQILELDGQIKARETESKYFQEQIALLRTSEEELSQAQSTLTRELEEARQKYQDEIENLNVRNQELQNSFEASQKQIREFTSIVEQQDLVNKRNRLAGQLNEKEAKLREISHRQEILESAMSEQQQALQLATSERENLEKEILKDKQTQKYLFEQLKLKEKSRTPTNDRAAPRIAGAGSNLAIKRPEDPSAKSDTSSGSV